MKRYRIVPEKKDAFSQLAAGMLLSPEDMEELAGATLLHIEVTPETNTWELLLRTIDVIDDDLLRRLALHVKETTGYSAVFYQAPINLGEAVAKSWHLLLVEARPHPVAHKQKLGFRMIRRVVYLVRLKFMEDRQRKSWQMECALPSG